jgi:lipid II:glycine glycyltransferase (peptidoglycan interpeptide bridge formation enzyme)
MKIKKVTETQKKSIDKIANHPLQSWEWGEFRKVWGNKVVRLPFGQVIFSKIPLRAIGPLGRRPNTKFTIGTFIKGPKPTKEMLAALKKLAKEENAIFIKLEPNFPVSVNGGRWTVDSKKTGHRTPNTEQSHKQIVKLLTENNCVPGKTLFTPTTFWIDLTKSEEELLKSFSSKTRYNIRLAQKKGVKVEVVEDPTSSRSSGLRGASNSDKAFERYIELTRETVERQGFYAHSEKYHRLMWKYLHKSPITNHQSPIARLLTAKFKGKIITTWIVFVWHDFLYYPYGASSDKHKEVMANNLMMWEAIRYGKKLGLKTFDLWGREEGKGFTKFKEGYNPQVIEYLGTWDLITSPLYWPYRVAEFVRWQVLRTKNKFIKPKF